MKFNEKLIKLRKKHSYTQEDLAEKLGVSRQAISRWESGDTVPDLASLRNICRIFNVSADYLINDDIEIEDIITVDSEVVKKNRVHYRKEQHKALYIALISIAVVIYDVVRFFLVTSIDFKLLHGFSSLIFLILFAVNFLNYLKCVKYFKSHPLDEHNSNDDKSIYW